jgi:hypothetical protein
MLIFIRDLNDWNLNGFRNLIGFEFEDSLNTGEVFTFYSGLVRLVQLNSSIVHLDGTVTSIDTVDSDSANVLVGWVLQRSLLLEDKITWLVIVNDGDLG